MSILTVFLPLHVAMAGLAPPAEPLQPVATAPAPVVAAKPILAVVRPGDAKLILVQQPVPGPQAAQPAAPALDKDAIIDKAGQALGSVKTAKGRFTQVDTSGTQSGYFYISRPGKIRFEYITPEPMFIISDGVTVSMQEPKRKSYDSAPLASTSFNLFLKSDVDLKKSGNVTTTSSHDGAYFVTLVDKTGEAQGKIELEFGAAAFDLRGWTATDGAGAKTKVKLTDTQTNVALQPALFVVKAPEDERR
jgi:outer membrane lipoprotein-sorting protein